MKPIPRFPAALSALALAAASAPGATLVVTSLDDDGPGTLRAVVASAQDGDVVTFADSLRGGTMTIVHRSHADFGIPVSASISIVGPEDRSIALDGGFDWSGGNNDQGSRILVSEDATKSLVCENLVFRNANGRDWGSTVCYGGAVLCEGDATFRACTFVSNRAASTTIASPRTIRGGGAMDVGGALLAEGCAFVGNTAPNPPSYGGAVLARGAAATFRDCSFDGDWTESHCAGVFLASTVRAASLERVSFSRLRGGTTNCRGAAIFSQMTSGGLVRLDACTFRGCGFHGPSWGGAIYSETGCDVVATDCEFSGNAPGDTGGAVRLGAGTAVFANCTFWGNAVRCHGGALDLRMEAWIVNCTVAGNFVTYPGDHTPSAGIFADRGTVELLNTAVVHNYWTKDSSLSAEQKNVSKSLALRASLDTAADGEEELFASYGTAAGATPVWGDPPVSFAAPVPVPLLNGDKRRSRVVEIARGGPLDGAGYPVKHSADWTAIAYSTDKGATWTALRGAVADATIRLDRDQRGASYSLRRTPIGAAAFENPAVTLLLVK